LTCSVPANCRLPSSTRCSDNFMPSGSWRAARCRLRRSPAESSYRVVEPVERQGFGKVFGSAAGDSG
jgi:hypothetical protein